MLRFVWSFETEETSARRWLLMLVAASPPQGGSEYGRPAPQLDTARSERRQSRCPDGGRSVDVVGAGAARREKSAREEEQSSNSPVGYGKFNGPPAAHWCCLEGKSRKSIDVRSIRTDKSIPFCLLGSSFHMHTRTAGRQSRKSNHG